MRAIEKQREALSLFSCLTCALLRVDAGKKGGMAGVTHIILFHLAADFHFVRQHAAGNAESEQSFGSSLS